MLLYQIEPKVIEEQELALFTTNLIKYKNIEIIIYLYYHID